MEIRYASEKCYTKEQWKDSPLDISIYEHVSNNSLEYLDAYAYNYYGKIVKYRDSMFDEEIFNKNNMNLKERRIFKDLVLIVKRILQDGIIESVKDDYIYEVPAKKHKAQVIKLRSKK